MAEIFQVEKHSPDMGCDFQKESNLHTYILDVEDQFLSELGGQSGSGQNHHHASHQIAMHGYICFWNSVHSLGKQEAFAHYIEYSLLTLNRISNCVTG